MMQVSKTLITSSKSVQYWRICSRAFASLTKEDGLTPIFEPKYYKAKKDRSNPNEIYKVDKTHGARLERPSRRSPSRDLNFTPETWVSHVQVNISHVFMAWSICDLTCHICVTSLQL